MTAKEILYKKAQEKNDGFMSGQVGWIVEAMEEYAAEKVKIMEDQINEIENNAYREGRESVSKADFNYD